MSNVVISLVLFKPVTSTEAKAGKYQLVCTVCYITLADMFLVLMRDVWNENVYLLQRESQLMIIAPGRKIYSSLLDEISGNRLVLESNPSVP